MTIPERTLEMLRALPGVTEDVKWGADLCYSVGAKMFAVFGTMPYPGREDEPLGGSFKVRDEEFDDLAGRPGLMPAPYLARAKWIRFESWRSLPISELEARLRTSYELVKSGLPKKTQLALSSGGPAPAPKKAKPTKVKPTKAKPTKVKPTKAKPTKANPTKAKRPPARGKTVRRP